MKTTAATLAIVLAVTGCATPPREHRTLVDYHVAGYDHQQYWADNAQCNELANTRGGKATDGAVGGLLAGALLGGIMGNAYGQTGHGAAYGAALGTTSGALQGAAADRTTHERIVRECMRGRGYTVLD